MSKERKKNQKRPPFSLLVIVMLIFVYFFSLKKERSISNEHSVMQKLINSYPEHLEKLEGNYLIWKDETEMEFFDSLENKNTKELLNGPSLIDQFNWVYNITDTIKSIDKNYDPGRIRYLPFFKKMYGETKDEVEKNLVEVIWLPKSLNQKLLVTTVNGVNKKLESISKELDEIPDIVKYLENPGGTFNWRTIKGTDRLSPHSFGMTIDINVKYSNYWQWDCKCIDEEVELKYKNRIPMKIVKIFEKYGFIWGGRWYHYDTMHFEYRPEMI